MEFRVFQLAEAFGTDFVLDLTVKKFDALCDLHDRNRRQELISLANVVRAAQNANAKEFTAFTDRLEHRADKAASDELESGRGLAGFLGRVGSGI